MVAAVRRDVVSRARRDVAQAPAAASSVLSVVIPALLFGLVLTAGGCRVSRSAAIDAEVAGGDGLPERRILDANIWETARDDGATDATNSDANQAIDASADVVSDADDGGQLADAAPLPVDAAGDGTVRPGTVSCDLATPSCPVRQACYPYPFESAAAVQARCTVPGTGGESIPCQSQTDCDATTICDRPGQPDSVCILRCILVAPQCPPGRSCRARAPFDGFGTCV